MLSLDQMDLDAFGGGHASSVAAVSGPTGHTLARESSASPETTPTILPRIAPLNLTTEPLIDVAHAVATTSLAM